MRTFLISHIIYFDFYVAEVSSVACEILHICIYMILLGDGVVSVSDGALELLAGFSDFSHRLHPRVLLPERAHLHRKQRHLQVTRGVADM